MRVDRRVFLDPLQKNLSHALAAIQIFLEGVQTLLATPLTLVDIFQIFLKGVKAK